MNEIYYAFARSLYSLFMTATATTTTAAAAAAAVCATVAAIILSL